MTPAPMSPDIPQATMTPAPMAPHISRATMTPASMTPDISQATMTPAPTTPDIHQATMTSAPTTPVSYPFQMEESRPPHQRNYPIYEGKRGRYASSDEQRHWQRQTSSLRKGVSVAEAAKRSSIASIGGKFAYASSTAGGVCWSAHYPSYATTSRCREPSASTITRCYVGSIRFRGVGTWFLSGLRAEGCACSLDGGYSTKWIAYGSFRPFGSANCAWKRHANLQSLQSLPFGRCL